MQVRTDDEVYRVDAVWLGPPKATFPWRARYVAWGVGILVFFLTLSAQRILGFGFGFFSVAWAVVITIVLTRLICSRISHERPLGAVFTMWVRELTTPRERSAGLGGAASATRIRLRPDRPRPRRGRRGDPRPADRPADHRRVTQPARSAPRVHDVQRGVHPGRPAAGHGRAARR